MLQAPDTDPSHSASPSVRPASPILVVLLGVACVLPLFALTWTLSTRQARIESMAGWVNQLAEGKPVASVVHEIIEQDPIGVELQAMQTGGESAETARANTQSTLYREQQRLHKAQDELQLSALALVAIQTILLCLGGAWWWRNQTRLTRTLRTAQQRERVAETRAADRQRLLQLAFESGPFGLHLFDTNGKPLLSMPNITRRRNLQSFDFVALGVDDIRKHPVLIALDGVDEFNRAASGETQHIPRRRLTLPGSGQGGPRVGTIHFALTLLPVPDETGKVAQVMAVVWDETDHEALRNQLQKVERLAEMGRLAAGVAHEMNNPLMYLSLNVATIRDHMQASRALDDQTQGNFDDIDHAIERIQGVTRELSSLANTTTEASELVNINKVVERAVEMSRTQLPGHIQLDASVSLLPSAWLSPRRLEQILSNLIQNAIRACPDGPAHIWITGGVDEQELTWLEITDDGVGMSDEVLERIFEPFFTTRRQGSGTGLGLYLVRCYLDEIGGDIQVQSAPGKGTTIRLYIPSRRHLNPAQQSPLVGLRLLVVDDDADTAARVRKLLPEVETVAHASTPANALARIRKNPSWDRILVADPTQIEMLRVQIDDPQLSGKTVGIPHGFAGRGALEATLRQRAV